MTDRRVLADSLRQAGAVMVTRAGHEVAGNYGSTTAELAACVSAAGVVIRSDLDVLELTAKADWLQDALSDAVGGVPLTGGWAVDTGSAWCAMVADDRALVVGAPGEIARWLRLAKARAIRSGHSIGSAERTATTTAMTLVGPVLGPLLMRAGLPTDVPVGGVRKSRLAGGDVVLLRQRPERMLLFVERDLAEDAWGALLTAGHPLDVALVGIEALERLDAAGRREPTPA
jgi:glycine cleavage system aminomethyltransferase T